MSCVLSITRRVASLTYLAKSASHNSDELSPSVKLEGHQAMFAYPYVHIIACGIVVVPDCVLLAQFFVSHKREDALRARKRP